MHGTKLIILILWLSLPATAIQFPFVANVSLVPRFSKSVTTLYNSSCDQCLCRALTNASAAVNCFLNNNTCQLFAYAPVSYRLQTNPQAILFFTNGAVPAPSQCCMPNTTMLIQKLQNATRTFINITNPRCLVIDDHGFLVTVQEYGLNLSRFNPQDLTLIDTTPFLGSPMNNIAYHQGAYFLSTKNATVLIVNSTDLTLINTVSAPGIVETRDMIFLKDGQTMVLVSAGTQQLYFFNRSNSSPRDYTYMANVTTSFYAPHGLTYVNETLFYVTSWTTRNVYSFTTNDNGTTWNESLYIDIQALSDNRWGAHVMIDDCERRWFSTSNNSLLIFNTQGQLVGTFNPPRNATFDAIFNDGRFMFLSDLFVSEITRLDPQINC